MRVALIFIEPTARADGSPALPQGAASTTADCSQLCAPGDASPQNRAMSTYTASFPYAPAHTERLHASYQRRLRLCAATPFVTAVHGEPVPRASRQLQYARAACLREPAGASVRNGATSTRRAFRASPLDRREARRRVPAPFVNSVGACRSFSGTSTSS
ncbi:hypothetical protein AURDEDRAFT_173142 [Auricularia subglabra TFB-10046 SS5]|nr:hypothetical protein AURDEDRAFT_173142 [Auricularia subglabra TFB-10046 SS5]